MEEEPTANSLQCDICQVQLRNTAAAQIHAEKTDHQSFSESTTVIKPLTEEEKKAKLQELRERLAAKRKAEAEVELENQKKNAVIERKKNQESSEVVEALQRKEELKAIAARKKEKEDDLKAKQSLFDPSHDKKVPGLIYCKELEHSWNKTRSREQRELLAKKRYVQVNLFRHRQILL